MELKHPGEICVIDLTDISRAMLHEMKKYDSEISIKDKAAVDGMLAQIMDDYLTLGMYWTKRKADYSKRRYLDLVRKQIKKHPRPLDMLDHAEDHIAQRLADIIELPTWNILSMRHRRGMIELEVGQDYRIVDWMKQHASEYGVEVDKYDW